MLLKTLRLKTCCKSRVLKTTRLACRSFFLVSYFSTFCLAFQLQAAETSSASLLKEAISKRQSGEHHKAIDILEKLRVQYMDHKRINIELAINHIKLKQYSEAEEILLHLQGMPLSEQESKKLTSLQKLIDRKSQFSDSRHTFSGEATAYLGVDNFISLNQVWTGGGVIYCYDYYDGDEYLYTECYDESETEDEDIGFVTEEDREEVKTKEQDTYTSQTLRFNYRYHPGKKITFFGQSTKLIWYNDLFLLQKQIKDESNNKYGQIKFDSALYFFSANRWVFDMRYRGVHHFNDGKRLLEDQGLQLTLAVPFDRARLKFGLEYRDKSYDKVLAHKSASVSTPWLEYSMNLTDELKLSVGSRYRQYRARDSFFTYDNLNFYLGLHYYPFDKTSAFVTLNYNKLNYLIDDPEIVNWGQENKRSIAVGLKYQFNEHFSAGINGHYVTNEFDMDFGNEDWNRVEGFISYRF